MNVPVYEALSQSGRSALADERDKIHVKLTSLNDERKRQETALAETMSRISSCEAAIIALTRLLGGNDLVAEQKPLSHVAVDGPRSVGDSIIEAVVAIFTEGGNQPLHYRRLTERVLLRGVTLGGKDAAGTLLSVITNARYSDRFERAARGTYRLAPGPLASPAPPIEVKFRKSRRRRRAKRNT